MHDGHWFAWHAAKRYRDQQLNPTKYKTIEEFKLAKEAKIGWNYNKIMQLRGHKDAVVKPVDENTLKSIFEKK